MRIAGVMSGSSLDGVDVVVVDFRSLTDWEVVSSQLLPYTEEWVDRLQEYHHLSARSYIAFKYAYSYYLAGLIHGVLADDLVDLISVHGHTLLHDPDGGFSEQIGNGAMIAARTGVPCLTDFRNGDMALGGQGAPLAPIADMMLYKGHDYYLNLGGIANITSVTDEKILAYDICPCNQVLNHYSRLLGQPYDKDGLLSRSGRKVDTLISYFDSWPYFDIVPPKSIDNNWIREQFIAGIPSAAPIDIMHSFTTWMVETIAGQVIHSPVEGASLLSTGGGTHNLFLRQMLDEALSLRNCDLVIPDSEVVDYKESILMALLGYLHVTDESNVLMSVTGASRDSIGGALYKC